MDRPTSPPPGTESLCSAECLDQLARAGTGYLATTERALPVIVPVTITKEPGVTTGVTKEPGHLLLAPLFSADTGDPPGTAGANTVVALAVGDINGGGIGDINGGGIWCVVAQGILQGNPTGPTMAHRRFYPEVVTGWRRPQVPG